MISLRGKIALITGGSRGIGLAIAKNFAAQGASTILVARDPERLRVAVKAVQDVGYCPPAGTPAHQLPFYTGVAGDVAQAATWTDLVAKLKSGQMGQRETNVLAQPWLPDIVDVLVNCAGIAQNSLLVRTSPETCADILDTNLRSAVLGCRCMARMTAGTGPAQTHAKSIINVSSVMALTGGKGAAVYAASKAGLLGLTSALAIELQAKGIRVNALLPGYIETDMTQALNMRLLRKVIPQGRLGKVEEVADAAAFLARNGYANNCVLNLDGGLTSRDISLPADLADFARVHGT